MISVAIEYPFMLFKRKAIGRAPSTWSELTEKQFIAISRIINGESPDYKFLSVLTGINKDLLKKLSPYERDTLLNRRNLPAGRRTHS